MKKSIHILLLLLLVNINSFAQETVLQKGLTAYYLFNGNSDDESGNENNGTVNGATLTADRFGNENSAYKFDGKSWISYQLNLPKDNESRSFSLWFKTDSDLASNNTEHNTLLCYGAQRATSLNNLSIFKGKLCFAGWGNDFFSEKKYNNNQWHHLIFTYNSILGNIKIYIDKKLILKKNTILSTADSDLFIGRRNEESEHFFEGIIDDIYLFNKSLSVNEIELLYEGQYEYQYKTGKKEDFIAYYPFNGNFDDESGNENNGTVNGATLTSDRFGNKNSAFKFDGKSWISYQINLPIENESRSFSLWFKTDGDSDLNNPGHNTLICYGAQRANSLNNLSLYNGKLCFAAWGNDFFSEKKYNDNQWHHLIFTYSSILGNIKIYIDKKIILKKNTILSTADSDLFIGRRNEESEHFFTGVIDDIFIFDKNLSVNEIEKLYEDQRKDIIADYQSDSNANSNIITENEIKLPDEDETKALNNNYQESIVDVPVITFINPQKITTTVFENNFTIQACIKSSESLISYKVYLNDVIQNNSSLISDSECNYLIENSIKLNEGFNEIIMTAENSGGIRTSKKYSIDYKKKDIDNYPPEITIIHPGNSHILKHIEQNKQFTILGKVKDESGILEVLINGQEAYVQSDGTFSKTFLLAFGNNKFTVKATDLFKNSTVKEFIIERKSSEQINNSGLLSGKFYALIIGVSEYIDPQIFDLNNEPVNDAKELYKILTTKYTFEKEDVFLLKNPSYKQIIRSFDDLNNIITEEDNLLIFFGGHGYYDDEEKVGYWLPSDAEYRYTDAWLYNSVLVDNIKRINSKHTLLISDACFSGSIFKTRSLLKNAPVAYKKKYELKSRNAITSGTLKTVPNESVFFFYLSEYLFTNKEEYMSASELFQHIEIPVGNNSPNTPQFGDIQNVDDRGGDFIFIRKK